MRIKGEGSGSVATADGNQAQVCTKCETIDEGIRVEGNCKVEGEIRG